MQKNKVSYWLDLVEYDFDTAKAMFDTKRWLYVGFMCHQVVEKLLKACYAFYKDEVPPFTHNLTKLALLADIFKDFSEEQKDFLDHLEPLNIESRYPAYKDEMLKLLTSERCVTLLEQTKDFKQWVLQRLDK
jgi:HEPN domain-containing protein